MKRLALLVTMLLAAGCGSDVEGQPQPQPKRNELGPATSACPMPITFQLLDGWRGVRQTLKTRQGDVLCQMLLGPTMDAGSLRIYRVTGTADSKAALEPLSDVLPGAENKVYQQVPVTAGTATELTYVINWGDRLTKSSMLAVPYRDGVVVLQIMGESNAAAYEASIKAYEQAKNTVTLT
ncbi:hypothetical protein SAMN05421504_11144 [Amycolatopsis xylanica]|uniref:Lipoprotein n=1 Tax=Amycolatopsis xylanica TaxID=589385 RepID=A0A1H3REX8_9PSEU|nr:lipoprotein [Amycolatopsis xylanica]SDZ24123.1 hypothetical protein SAMN05421504_11144 [Amycolatopsis xylanica]